MKNATAFGIVALVLACAIGGFLAGSWHASQKARQELARQTYDSFTSMGTGDDPDRRALWRQELRGELERALAQPWSAKHSTADWGFAYLILRDQGDTTWRYVDAMSSGQQDEMIRYLSFRIEMAATWPDNCRGQAEFKALASYPKEAVDRNKDKVKPAIVMAASSRASGVRQMALAYATYLTDMGWGRELCSECLGQASIDPEIHPLPWVLMCLDEQARGKARLVKANLNTGKPSAEVRAGAAEVLKRFVQTDFENLGAQERASVEAWMHSGDLAALAALASQPATQHRR